MTRYLEGAQILALKARMAELEAELVVAKDNAAYAMENELRAVDRLADVVALCDAPVGGWSIFRDRVRAAATGDPTC